MAEEEKEKESNPVSRRSFLKGAGLVVGGAAAGAAAGAGVTYGLVPPKEVVKEVPKEVPVEVVKEVQVPVTGVLEPAFEPEETFIKNLGYCGNPPFAGSLASSVDVKNGRIVRIRPFHFDEKYTPEEYNAWQINARGKTFEPLTKTLVSAFSLAYKKRVYSPNRIKYPLKRVDWEPGGDPAKTNPQNRGKSKFKRISWDEATDIIASEMERIKTQYGENASSAVYPIAAPHGQTKHLHYAHGVQTRAILPYMGAPCGSAGAAMDSWTGWILGAQHVWGMTQHLGIAYPATNVIKDISENSDMVLHWGCDIETSPLGWGGYQAGRIGQWWRELGIKQVFVDPILNYAAAVYADKWIPILPNTDVALHLAISYVWMTEGTYDKDYVATHTVGFDKYQDYVLGKEDGVPKTPNWASPICGVPVWTIKALAREWASKKTSTAHGNGGCMIRGPYSHEPGRTEPLNLAMQGVGKPGRHEVGMIEWNHFGSPEIMNPLPHPTVLPDLGKAVRKAPFAPAKQNLPGPGFADGVLKGTYSCYSVARFDMPQWDLQTYPAEGCPEIHMIWSCSPCWLACKSDSNSWIDAMRSPKIEFVVTQHPWMEDGCQYSDIILPTDTKFEEYDIGEDVLNGTYPLVFLEGKCIPNVGESKSDFEAVGEVAKKLGVYDAVTEGKTDEEWIRAGFDNSGIQERISWEEFKAKGYYVVPTKPDWEKDPVGLAKFVEDPKTTPLETPSGLIEFESQGLKEHFPDDKERPPVPHWVPGGPGWTHDESLTGERAKTYPLLLISNHPKWRVHAEHDDITWLREIPTCKVKGPDGYLYEPVWINPVDAAERGIVSGDIVKIYNERGAVLGGAYVTERMIAGALSQDHGARGDPITDRLDRGGSNNLITPGKTSSANATGDVSSGFLVELEKVTPDQMEEWKKEYPEAFEREYDPAAGLRFNAWVEGGMV
jgi:molybdopterin guanine dinucleotide-containing S/N-oxide reductase-like protein